MLFAFGPRSSLLLPFVLPGAVATLWLLGRAWRRGSTPDALLALLLLLPTLIVSQWMLGYAGWFDSHDGYSTVMFYVPWQLSLLMGPGYYLYFRSLTNQEFRLGPRAWGHLLPGLGQVALFAGVALLDLGWRRGLHHEALPDFYGTKGAAATWRDTLFAPLNWLAVALLVGYGLRMLADYRRYAHYLNDNFSDPERLRFAGLRQLLVLQALVLALGLVGSVLNYLFDLSYDAAWYLFALRGVLIYGLIVVGLQANYAAATSPLRFEPDAAPTPGSKPDGASWLAEAPGGEPNDVPDLAAGGPGASQPLLAEPTAPAALPPELLPWRDKLLALMATEQPWLEPELTLTELAQRLRTTPNVLSKVINAGCGQNFNDFVNTYRVHEARRKLADPRLAHYSLVGVALESGFNSKSTFNRVFKKLLGQAPSEVARPKS
ncbi:helix-turn-helix domain-containing protein [Hymenobacter cheonanensis]|uniref:helix-turn-helix domain-containing protein n=1 Tax=Hymenobacter sp. CA2-7 TaxID=3063993 RepID=UPI0027129924|nr:helix-turn-helix transcriptional regulator [Hymenobacter sp. CA2-7]MDO7886521.1 helix-turn-helix transcriptional regulator [Hymenobacter sp. CA2-7]